MRAVSTWVLAGFLAMAGAVSAQAQAAQTRVPRPAAPPAPKAASGVDTVIALVKGGMSEALVIKTLQTERSRAAKA